MNFIHAKLKLPLLKLLTWSSVGGHVNTALPLLLARVDFKPSFILFKAFNVLEFD